MASQYRTRGYRPGELVHLTVRGFRRQRIFFDKADHEWFLDRFVEINESLAGAHRVALHANAQMPNHAHLLARNGSSETAISRIMQKLCTEYAIDFNWRRGKGGQVFERPFRGKVLRTVDHVMNTFAYIHLNPDNSLRHKNSSHGVYAGLRDDPRIDTSLGFEVFGGRERYFEFFDDTERLRVARAAARLRVNDLR
jgi:REP element-mobilizing transposase RayT